MAALSDFDYVRLEEGSTTDKIVFPTAVRKLIWPTEAKVEKWEFPLVKKCSAASTSAATLGPGAGPLRARRYFTADSEHGWLMAYCRRPLPQLG